MDKFLWMCRTWSNIHPNQGLDGREPWEPGTGLRGAVGNEGLNVGTVV